MSAICPKCTAPAEAGAKICQFCGGDLDPQVPAGSAAGYTSAGGGKSPQDYDLHLDDIANTTYSKASLSGRFVANLLDSLFTALLAIPAVFIGYVAFSKMERADVVTGVGAFVLLIVLVLIPLAYALIKDGLGAGQSWGKRVMNLMVINTDNHMPCTKGASAIRNIVSMVLGSIPYIGWLIEPIVLLSTKDGRKVGDMAARTQVIETREYR
ncbi:MAG: RDD family protein [Chitinophaga sp.]|uniref:RDD family protein n=1 Tax=Chitinophaga sp. TaxID=1869181 RepID=UPI001B291D45|nr:RDD family protein [Chitinophaga sp.]MBO9729652.1 RDD family protein [Chitinophaga sp.]